MRNATWITPINSSFVALAACVRCGSAIDQTIDQTMHRSRSSLVTSVSKESYRLQLLLDRLLHVLLVLLQPQMRNLACWASSDRIITETSVPCWRDGLGRKWVVIFPVSTGRIHSRISPVHQTEPPPKEGQKDGSSFA